MIFGHSLYVQSQVSSTCPAGLFRRVAADEELDVSAILRQEMVKIRQAIPFDPPARPRRFLVLSKDLLNSLLPCKFYTKNSKGELTARVQNLVGPSPF